jgi:hypothetical protein
MSVGIISKGIGSTKEYIYRGFQQLPIVLASTSLVYTVASGSLAHMGIFLGMSAIIPFYTFAFQSLLTALMNAIPAMAGTVFWKRAGGDICNIIPSRNREPLSYFDQNPLGGGAVPSYWLMGISYFIGYAISNAADSLLTPAENGASDVQKEKRNTQAIFILITTCVFSFMVLGMRLYFARGCEGAGTGGIIISLVAALGAASIGYGMYTLSRACGARSSDLFGVLSQILPVSSTSPHPIVCTADTDDGVKKGDNSHLEYDSSKSQQSNSCPRGNC